VHWPGVWGAGIKGWICEDGLSKWGDLLAKAGVSLVISGHTHQHAWFPAKEARPWGQLIGGGPQPLRATSIVARADERKMEIVLKNLAGEVMWREEFLPKA
jgi:hypothetical protein